MGILEAATIFPYLKINVTFNLLIQCWVHDVPVEMVSISLAK